MIDILFDCRSQDCGPPNLKDVKKIRIFYQPVVYLDPNGYRAHDVIIHLVGISKPPPD
jgi:hypothetical protein